MASVDSLVARVQTLVRLAPWWSGWTAPMDPAQLAAFESKHGVELPRDHREVLLRIGDRAPLPSRPDRALLALAAARERSTAAAFLGPLADPFAHSGDATVALAWDDEADDYADPRWLRGCLPLTGAGCDESFVLVVSGADRGRVWRASPSGEPELHPTGQSFAAWYAAELDAALARHEARVAAREALRARVRSDPEDHTAALALARACLFDADARVDADARETATRLLEELSRRAPDLPGLAQTLAELDLLEGRIEASDRIDGLAERDPPWCRCYAGIAAARRDDRARALALFGPGGCPAVLGALVAGHHALILARRGAGEDALALLRRSATSRDNLELAAAIHEARGEPERAEAIRARLERAQAEPRPPRPPTLADLLPLPSL